MESERPAGQHTGWGELLARSFGRGGYLKLWLAWLIIVVVIGIVLALFCHGALLWLLIAVYASILGVAVPCTILAFTRYEMMLEWHKEPDHSDEFRDWVSKKTSRYQVTPDDLEASAESSHGCCSICLAEYDPGDAILELPCGHRFHEDCFRECFTASTFNERKCPMCRSRVGPRETTGPRDPRQNTQLMRIW
ncbi:hypothetical protein FOZ61_005880 [Perkinsus olseni]|uniref:RING-type domain-containing protein n=1 Tax=Perkinsus olseni TaxID=32597 RepID=A0A7J6MXZ7_PEROL|nr:hypothetical protein FOZ61_005880 [Perkinsus olseni]KAF4676443.1 hypothetical protein FOL46_002949 [Perkinsus olseni]